MFRNGETSALGSSPKTILLGAALWLAATAPSLAQSYDPDLGAGNTAPPGITYGGGLPEGRYGGVYGGYYWNHRAEVLRHRPRHLRYHAPR